MSNDDVLLRLEHLEREVDEVKTRLAALAPPPPSRPPFYPPPPPHGEPSTRGRRRGRSARRSTDPRRPEAEGPPKGARPSAPRDDGSLAGFPRPDRLLPASLETSVLGTWFARIGAIALLMGAAFGFKYAIDKGFIGPAARVLLGVATGAGGIAWGEWARRREWSGFAQAVSAGGVGMLYLSILSAMLLFDLIPAGIALLLLTGVAVLSGGLSLRHDSLALAVLASVAGFLNALLIAVDSEDAVALFSYIVVIDLGVSGLAYFRRWWSLNALTLGGTWLLYVAGIDDASLFEAGTFATVFFLVFALLPVVSSIVKERTSESRDVALATSNAFIYFAAILDLLGRVDDSWQGPFTFSLCVFHLAFAGLVKISRRHDPLLMMSMIGLSVAFLTIGVAIQLDEPHVAITWCVEGALLAWLADRSRHPGFRLTGLAVTGLSFIAAMDFVGSSYEPRTLLVSADSFVLMGQIACMYVAAGLFSKTDRELDAMFLGPATAVGANLLTMGWVGYEAIEQLERMGADSATAIQFTLSAILGLYSAGLLFAGVAIRRRWVRWFGVSLFGVLLVKLVFIDLWLLDSLYRTVAFIGLGALMLLCSLAFNRFKELLLTGGAPDPGW